MAADFTAQKRFVDVANDEPSNSLIRFKTSPMVLCLLKLWTWTIFLLLCPVVALIGLFKGRHKKAWQSEVTMLKVRCKSRHSLSAVCLCFCTCVGVFTCLCFPGVCQVKLKSSLNSEDSLMFKELEKITCYQVITLKTSLITSQTKISWFSRLNRKCNIWRSSLKFIKLYNNTFLFWLNPKHLLKNPSFTYSHKGSKLQSEVWTPANQRWAHRKFWRVVSRSDTCSLLVRGSR